MRALFAGEEVTHDGLVAVDRARLWTLPAVPPMLLAAAVSPATARWAAGWADGLITVAQDPVVLRHVLDAFRDGGGDRKPVYLQVHVSWAPTKDEAAAIALRPVAHQRVRPTAVLGPGPCRALRRGGPRCAARGRRCAGHRVE